MLLTTKRTAHLPELPLLCGRTLHDVTVGYETYGTLSPERDNAILVCHFFSGSSHAAGRYAPEDLLPGWWDPIIGAGKAIDTDRWFVVAMDAPGCVRLDAPHGVTTSAASVDPATQRPYGPDFPALDIADMVAAQRLVLDQLGVGKLAAVAGPSLGAMQALEWAVRRPDEVGRVIAAIGLAAMQPREQGVYHAMERAITVDPAYRDGRYDPADRAFTGFGIAVELMMLMAGGETVFGAPPREDSDGFDAWLSKESGTRALACDPNAWVALLRTNRRWRLGGVPLPEAAAKIQAPVLLLPAADDTLLSAEGYHQPLSKALREAGVAVSERTLPAGFGHLGGLALIGQAEDAIRAHLGEPALAK